ncbi:MAG: dihydroorotase [Clostridiales bacterium]|jgi:allantoinase|nr:dihydroorotase [Clostridiales bacterium]
MNWDHVIKNGTIVTPNESYKGNIYVKDGKIAAISAWALGGDAEEVTDAAGKHVMAGFIDTHTHSRDGYNGAHYKEDFSHSSAAAAAGGVTTMYEMPNCNPAVYNVENLNKLVDCITPKAHVDFAVWGLCLGGLNNSELMALREAGVIGFKFFWGYAIDAKTYQLIYNYDESMKDVIPPLDEGEVYKIFREVAKTGKIVGIHAENFDIIKTLTEEVKATGDTSYAAMLRARPSMSETTIIETAINIAREVHTRLHILHLAAGDGVALVRRAQREGLYVTAETCPHYLALTDQNAITLGALMKGYPPVRTQYDQDLLWRGLNEGVLAHVCSDHAPHALEEKQKPLWEVPAGMATVETMSMIMLNAVNAGKLTLNKLSDVMSMTPAKLYGTYPQKGALLVGADADIVIVDMNRSYTFHQEELHSRTKLSPYDGWKLRGKAVQTILRGRTVAKDGQIIGKPGGKFIKPAQ